MIGLSMRICWPLFPVFVAVVLLSCKRAQRSDANEGIISEIRISSSDGRESLEMSGTIGKALEEEGIQYDVNSSAGIIVLQIAGNLENKEILELLRDMENQGVEFERRLSNSGFDPGVGQ